MKICLKKLSIIILILLTGFLFLSNNVNAAVPQPYATMSGTSFTYTASTNALVIDSMNISQIRHADGSWAFSRFQDPLVGGSFSISSLFNGDGVGQNWSFAPTAGSNPDLTLYDYYTNQRLNADIYDFTVVPSGSLFEVNVNFDQDNVGNFVTNPNSPTSEFISDVNSFSPPWGNLYMKFSFSGTGATDFTEDQFGSVTGTIAIAPEPVSSMLFITGGATLAFRRFRRTRSI